MYDRLPRARARREHENLLAMVLLEFSMRMTMVRLELEN